MAIRISRREGATSCPYCLDEVAEGGGPACPACGVRYHDECALTFGRCGILGCRAPLDVAAPEATPLPRLVAMAARLFALRPGAAPLDDEAHVVALLPGSPESVDGAGAVGELLGQSTYDGRLRLLSSVPEPLVRVRTAADAEAVVSRLASYRVKALAVPAAELLRPLVRVDVVELEPGDPPRIVDPIAGPAPLPTPRLVVAAMLLEVHQREDVKWETRRSKKGRPTTRKVSERLTEPAALVFGARERDPALLRRDGTRLRGSADPTATGRWASILDACSSGAATVVRLENAVTSGLLSRRRPLGTPVDENLPGVLLVARLLHAAWASDV